MRRTAKTRERAALRAARTTHSHSNTLMRKICSEKRSLQSGNFSPNYSPSSMPFSHFSLKRKISFSSENKRWESEHSIIGMAQKTFHMLILGERERESMLMTSQVVAKNWFYFCFQTWYAVSIHPSKRKSRGIYAQNSLAQWKILYLTFQIESFMRVMQRTRITT